MLFPLRMPRRHRHNRRSDTAEAHPVYPRHVQSFLPVRERRQVPPAEPASAVKQAGLSVRESAPPQVPTMQAGQTLKKTMMFHRKQKTLTKSKSAPPHKACTRARIEAYKLFFSCYFTIVHFPVNVLPGSRTTCSDTMSPSRDPVAVTKTSYMHDCTIQPYHGWWICSRIL